jgi:hypothetical protein
MNANIIRKFVLENIDTIIKEVSIKPSFTVTDSCGDNIFITNSNLKLYIDNDEVSTPNLDMNDRPYLTLDVYKNNNLTNAFIYFKRYKALKMRLFSVEVIDNNIFVSFKNTQYGCHEQLLFKIERPILF